MTAKVFLPSEWDAKVEAAAWRYHQIAIHSLDLSDADEAWAELQKLRADRDAFYADRAPR